jgi:hypothetical protein
MFAALCFIAALYGAADAPIATVNGRTLTEQDLALFGLFHSVDPAAAAVVREQHVRELIERQLVRQFLERRKVSVPAESVALRVHQLEETLRSRGDDPPAVYARLGVTAEQVRNAVALPLMWKAHVELAVTSAQIRQHFDEHRSELDGTRVRVQHLFRKATSPGEVATAESLLKMVRSDVEQKRIKFTDAVKQHSQSPSANEGGDVGWIAGRGKLPDELTAAALKLQPGELAGPIRSPFGVHLIQVTEREPGQLSPEDARPQILDRLSQRLWSDTVADERSRSKIVIPAAK